MSNQIETARSLRKRLTPQEVKVWVRLRELRSLGFHFRRQMPIGPYIVDFACRKNSLVVEIDGGQHGVTTFAQRDAVRDAYLQAQGFRIRRFWNNEIDRNLQGVIETIFAVVQDPHPARKGAPPCPDGGGIGAAADPSSLGEGGRPKSGRVGSEHQ